MLLIFRAASEYVYLLAFLYNRVYELHPADRRWRLPPHYKANHMPELRSMCDTKKKEAFLSEFALLESGNGHTCCTLDRLHRVPHGTADRDGTHAAQTVGAGEHPPKGIETPPMTLYITYGILARAAQSRRCICSGGAVRVRTNTRRIVAPCLSGIRV